MREAHDEMPVDASEDTLPVGMESLIGRRLLDRYQIESRIGRGGMSVVFLAKDVRLDRTVAVKVFFSEQKEGRQATASHRHFVQEAFALSRLSHPHTLRIYDFACFEEHGAEIPFQVAEYMDDGTLAELVAKRGKQSPQQAAQVVECIAGALSEAHQQGIIHRDVKPSNILFARVGRERIVKLADFSIAQASVHSFDSINRALGDRTVVSAPFCSLGWSAPEQIRGGTVDVTADIYGLGMVFAFMLAGARVLSPSRPLEAALDSDKLDAALSEGLSRHELPSALAAVCFRAGRARPEERYPNIDAFLESVRSAMASLSMTGATRAKTPLAAARVESAAVSIAPLPGGGPLPRAAGGSGPPHGAASVGVVATLSDLTPREWRAGGRGIRIIACPTVLDVDGTSPRGAPGPRFRVTWLPSRGGAPHVHIRGLNCFVSKRGGIPTSGMDVTEDTDLEFVATDRTWSGTGKVWVSTREGDHRVFKLPGLRVLVPALPKSEVLLLELASEPEARLLHHSL